MSYKFDLYIHANTKNHIPALVASNSFSIHNPNLKINIKYLEDSNMLMQCNNKMFKRNGQKCMLNVKSSQSFFFILFMCVEYHKKKKNNQKWILVTDPDIFCLKSIIDLNNYIKEAEKKNKHIIAFNVKSSFMLINTELISWSEKYIVNNVFNLQEDAEHYMGLSKYKDVILNLPEIYNSYDKLNSNTICLHTSLTHQQPWKTGIKYFPSDLHNRIPNKNEEKNKIFEKHPNNDINNLVFSLFKKARDKNIFSDEDIKEAIKNEALRPDIFNLIK